MSEKAPRRNRPTGPANAVGDPPKAKPEQQPPAKPDASAKAPEFRVAKEGELPPPPEASAEPMFTLRRRADQDAAEGAPPIPPEKQIHESPYDSSLYLEGAPPEYEGGPLWTDEERRQAAGGDPQFGEFGPDQPKPDQPKKETP